MPAQPTGPHGATSASQGPVGRITGTSVGELRFRIGPDEPVHLGEILIADPGQPPASPVGAASGPSGPLAQGSLNGASSLRSADPFYLRVVDLEYGADARDGD